ncbi:hypothetical protein, partial [Methylosoma difficile]
KAPMSIGHRGFFLADRLPSPRRDAVMVKQMWQHYFYFYQYQGITFFSKACYVFVFLFYILFLQYNLKSWQI